MKIHFAFEQIVKRVPYSGLGAVRTLEFTDNDLVIS
jgi:hypothetical protein